MQTPTFTPWHQAVAEGLAKAIPLEAATPMRAYMVRFIRGGVVERQFEAMAPDCVTCVQQHVDDANGAKLDVMGLGEWKELQRTNAYLPIERATKPHLHA